MEQGKQVGEWRCQKLLGRGSFGSVALWRNLKTQDVIAVKRFEIRSAVQPNDKLCLEMQKRWQKEVDIMYNSIDCKFVVSTTPVPPDFLAKDVAGNGEKLTAPPLPLLCMEYCSGGDLRRLLKRPENICGLREKEVRTILEHISKAVAYLHEKSIIHRDLKPENILCVKENTHTIYKLSDLGFAKDLSNSSNLCSTVVGTLQYLAPEIYLGKMYDKSVDYWSFALIAFEIMTGMRPFLHGESPAQWLPLVEEKPRDAICIYRRDDREIEFSKTIPFYTHCTDLFKQCAEAWLRTMLQLDPSRRGKKLSAPGEDPESRSPSPSVPIVGLQMLSNILSTKTLHIRTVSKRLGFAIGKSTKMSDIQQLIQRDIGLPVDSQLILTNDGVEVKKDDLAAKFVEHTDLFLIPRSPDLIRQRLKMPKNVNMFLTSWQNIKDPLKLRLIWSCAVYFIQSELEKVETLKKASNALKAWINTKYTLELRNLQSNIDKAGACLERILELDNRLEDLEKAAKKYQESPFGSGIAYWKSEMEALRTFYCGCLDDWRETVVLKPISESKLEEVYYNVLRGLEERASDGSIIGAHSEALVTNVCQFVVQRDQIAESITHNVTAQLEKVRNDQILVENLRSVVEKLNALTNEVIENRCNTHSRLLGLTAMDHVNGTGPYTGEQKTFNDNNNKRQLNPVGVANPNSISGGSRHSRQYSDSSSAKLMSKSASAEASPVANKSNPQQGKCVAMARSLNSPLNHRLCSSPPISKLMEESMIIKSETEDTLKTLDSTMDRISSLLECPELDWEFLDS